jgi:hypothetical protein
MKSPKVYLYTEHETFNTMYALLQGVDLINHKDGRFNIGVAFKSPILREIASQAKWISLPVVSPEEVPSDIPLLDISPSQARIDYWGENDKELEQDFVRMKLGNPDEVVPNLLYSEYHAILRDLAEIFDFTFGETPSAIYAVSRGPRQIVSKTLDSYAVMKEMSEGIKSGAYVLIEKGFAGWNGSNTPPEWGRVIMLPNPEEITTIEEAKTYFGLLVSPLVAALGIHSTDWIAAANSVFQVRKNVIWDIRPSTARNNEDLDYRSKLCLTIPTGIKVLSIIGELTISQIETARELSWAIASYYTCNKPKIEKNQQLLEVPPKPFIPVDYRLPGESLDA